MTFNPGPWRANGMVVVCDTPVPDVNGSDAVEYYGGHLIAESVSHRNAPLIAAAPELLALCQECLRFASGDLLTRLNSVVFSVTGECVPVVTKDHQCKHKMSQVWIDVPGEWVGKPIACIQGHELRIKPTIDLDYLACPSCSSSVFLIVSHDEKHLSCTNCGGWGSIQECKDAFDAIPF